MNGHSHHQNGSSQETRSHLRAVPEDELLDALVVGFGPASLAIAVALHDALDTQETASQLRTQHPKIEFLERQPEFAWHAGMQIPGAKMQISFVKDLATLRNPRSEFTFINYLHRNNRLVQFTNLGTFLPRRIEYEDYMRWCAGWFEEVVSYGEEVLDIEQNKGSTDKVQSFTVTYRNIHSGKTSTRRAKNVVIAAGGQPNIPAPLPQNHPRVLHSSQYRTASSKIFPDPTKSLRIAVIGGGQSAAEIFNDIPSQFPNSKAFLILKSAALRPSDDSPFVNEIFDPDRVDDIFSQAPDVRASALALDKGTNYGVVRLELLEHIYDEMYTQRLTYGGDESRYPRRILPHRNVTGVEDRGGGDKGVRLVIKNSSSEYKSRTAAAAGEEEEETLDVDLVMIASGYRRDIHEMMLKNVRHLMVGGDEEGNKWTVGRDYRVLFQDGVVAEDAGVYLQGCNEATHGVSLFLLMIERG